jgi:hypothetical protein
MIQVLEGLSSKHEDLSPNPVLSKKKKNLLKII